MSNLTVCVRFRPLSSKETKCHGDNICISMSDAESFAFKDEKEDLVFCFDRVFYQDAAQADVYEFLALPIVQDAVNGINGTIITYGQTGAGKTYTMEGPSILNSVEHNKGLLPRVVDGIFECMNLSPKMVKYNVKLSMVEIYMEKIRDLFDLAKDNLQIKEGKDQEIFLSGTTEVCILDHTEALGYLSRGIANRAVGETHMNVSSSRSHCVYIFSIQQESSTDRKVKTGKLVLLDLAGSEKVEKTGAEGRVLDEAKTINKSLSALGNVISALTSGRVNHIPYRDSKLTRILQDALGGNSRTALLCCCSPSSLNASESLSTLRFGSRAKLIMKTPPRATVHEDKGNMQKFADSHNQSDLLDRILEKLREDLTATDVNLLEAIFATNGVSFSSQSIKENELACDDAPSEFASRKNISSLQQAVDELGAEREQLKLENGMLEAKLATASYFMIIFGIVACISNISCSFLLLSKLF